MSRVLLSFRLPRALEDEALDCLVDQGHEVEILHARARGPQVMLASAMEQVRGKAECSLLQLEVEVGEVKALVESLQARCRLDRLRWRVQPLLDEGWQ